MNTDKLVEKIGKNIDLTYLLSNDPNDVLSRGGILLRRVINAQLRKEIPKKTTSILDVVRRAEDPKGVPIIYAATHGFKDDIAHSIQTIGKHSYLLFGSLPAFFDSPDGIPLWLNGVVLVDRKDKESKKASVDKMVRAIELGAKRILVFPEGVWNKTPNLLVQSLYNGVYDVAERTGAVVMPLATTLDDGICHSILDEAFDITQYGREEGRKVLRDKMATIKYELMLKYSNAKREDFDPGYWDKFIEDLIATTNGHYDYEVENTTQYIEKGTITEREVFSPLQNVPVTKENAHVLMKLKDLK